MKLTKKQKSKLVAVSRHMADGGKVLIKDAYDNTVKQSDIVAIYSDYTIVLADTFHSEYSIDDVTIIPLNNFVNDLLMEIKKNDNQIHEINLIR